MSWWPLWGAQRGRPRDQQTPPAVEAGLLAAEKAGFGGPAALATPARTDRPTQRASDRRLVRPLSAQRIRDALDRLEIRYLVDPDENVLAMWERHALLVALEGPESEILVMRVRPHHTVCPEWADRAYRAVNEWNYTRRFVKAYVGDPTERGMLPIYGEIQVPLLAGVHDQLLDELLDCGAAVANAFVDWLHDDGGLL